MNQKESVLKVLSGIVDPWMKADYLSTRMAKVADDGSSVTIELGYPAKSVAEGIQKTIDEAMREAGLTVKVEVVQKIIAHAVQRTLKVLPNVRQGRCG